ncbi:TetR/AcrR family transcriptional regulator [Tsuneonella amylolytica]|uniref:TetR/AcrR family transcriptional regulator n=1 Tax=Tsuneonella amylolytica TaxID=2338327 RepID=UPI000EAAA066|nr:TetR/AcrR family transcriptional regulator [Tsuneonella amylolytica]
MEMTREELHELVWSQPITAVAEEIGMSGNGLAKLCDRLDIPRPPSNHWTRASTKRGEPVALPAAPRGMREMIRIGERGKAVQSKPRLRLDLETRRAQLLEAAARIALEHGLAHLTMKTVAREVGISDAQVHNCFGGRTDLLVALARREIAAISARRGVSLFRSKNRRTRIVISTISYLHEAAERGPLLQLLLRNSDVKRALRPEREAKADSAREAIVRGLTERGGLGRDVATASTIALTAISLRAGGIVAARRAPFEIVERLCIALTMAGIDSDDRLVRSMRGPR